MADKYLGKLVIGNAVIDARSLRDFLIKSHYWLTFEPKDGTIRLSANHNAGGVCLLEVRNASHENAVRLAEELGLKSDGRDPAVSWTKWNPVLELDHDGSESAERLRIEMLRLGIPFRLVSGCRELALIANQGRHTPPMWSEEAMLGVIRKTAADYADQLAGKP